MRISRDLLIVGGGRLTTALLAVVSIRIATGYLPPTQYGELVLLTAVQMFCGLFLVNPVGQHINRHTHQWWDEKSLLSRLTTFRRYVVGVSLLGAFAAFWLIPQPSTGQALVVSVITLLMVNAQTWNTTSIPMLNMVGFRGASVVLAVATGLIGLGASVFFVMWSPSAIAWFGGQVVGMAAGAVGAGWVLRYHARRCGHAPQTLELLDRRTIRNYCVPLALATGFMWLQLGGYRFVIQVYWGLESLGYVAVGLAIATQIWAVVESLVQQFLYPLFYRRITNASIATSQSALSDLLNVMGPLYLVLAGTVLLGAPYILRLLVAPEYAEADFLIRLGVAVETCRVLANLLGNAAQVTKQTRSMTLPYAVGAAATIGLMVLAGSQHLHIAWAGAVLALASGVTLVAMLIAMYRQVPFSLDLRRWVAGLFAVGCLGLAASWVSAPSDAPEAIGALVMIGVVAFIITAPFLWHSAALKRLLSVNLH